MSRQPWLLRFSLRPPTQRENALAAAGPGNPANDRLPIPGLHYHYPPDGILKRHLRLKRLISLATL